MTAIAPTRAAHRGFGRAAAAASALAVLTVLGIYVLARLAGDELIVTVPGRGAGPVPVIAAVAATLLCGVAAPALALLVARLDQARRWFVAITTMGLVIQFGSPFAAAEHTSTALWRCAMHIAAAEALIALIARTLPTGGTR